MGLEFTQTPENPIAVLAIGQSNPFPHYDLRSNLTLTHRFGVRLMILGSF